MPQTHNAQAVPASAAGAGAALAGVPRDIRIAEGGLSGNADGPAGPHPAPHPALPRRLGLRPHGLAPLPGRSGLQVGTPLAVPHGTASVSERPAVMALANTGHELFVESGGGFLHRPEELPEGIHGVPG